MFVNQIVYFKFLLSHANNMAKKYHATLFTAFPMVARPYFVNIINIF